MRSPPPTPTLTGSAVVTPTVQWHDRSNPTVSVFLLDIPPAGLPGQPSGSFFDLRLRWDVDAGRATWAVGGTANSSAGPSGAAASALQKTRAGNMTIGAGGCNYVTVQALGPGGVCVATARKQAV